MSARDQLLADLQQAGLSTPRAEATIDAYAHELAEQQRATGRDDYCPGVDCCGEHGGVADLIDPLTSHGNGWHDTGRDAPGEEPTE